jgi:PTH1 family peptidyl-tRNA hydrolase
MSPQPIKLIVGLGNPGREYEDTRHNAGFWFLELLARQHGAAFKAETKHLGQTCRFTLRGQECRLLKPTTFMNRSGQSVSSLANYYRITPQEILVAHDELDLPAGGIRLKSGGGHAGHNGLRDIMSATASQDFVRLRIGIDHPNERRAVVDYVLSKPSKADRQAIDQALEAAADCLTDILAGNLQKAMHQLHTGR